MGRSHPLTKSMKGHQPQASKNTSWITPRWITDELGDFDLDPCTPDEMPWEVAYKRFTVADNGLELPWHGFVWLNPPFDVLSRDAFLRRMVEHDEGIALLPVSTETWWFKEYVWPYADSILFLRVRPHFHYPTGERAKANSGCSICLVGYGKEATHRLAYSGLGHHVRLKGLS